MLTIDTSELKSLGAQLAGGQSVRRSIISSSVKKGAQNVKTAIQADLQSSSNPAFRRIRISYELQTVGITGIAADISPDKGGASNLANIAFFGTAKGGGTHQFYEHAEHELPSLADYVAQAGSEAMIV